MDPTLPALAELAAQRRGGSTVACIETVTVGMLAQALATATYASEWFRGGVVTTGAATTPSTHPLFRPVRSVEEPVAVEMARLVAEVFGSDVGLATLGVAVADDNPRPVGTVVIGWSAGRRTAAESLSFAGDDTAIRTKATRAALARLSGALAER